MFDLLYEEGRILDCGFVGVAVLAFFVHNSRKQCSVVMTDQLFAVDNTKLAYSMTMKSYYEDEYMRWRSTHLCCQLGCTFKRQCCGKMYQNYVCPC